jgi:hypothetical protein
MSTKNHKIIKKKNTEHENNIEEIKFENDIKLDKISKGGIFEKTYNISIKYCLIILKTIYFLFKISGIYILWIFLHYFSAHLYVNFCVPKTFIGFIMSPFMISSPHCQGLRWIVYNAANIINNMWILIGSWIYSLIWIINSDAPAYKDKC